MGRTRTLSESDSKKLLARYGVPVLPEASVSTAEEAAVAAADLGWPVVAKLNGDQIAHKTERGLVRLGLGDAAAVAQAADALLAAATPEDGDVSVLIAPMIDSVREFICGVATDPQFGPTVLLGVGGVLTEAIADVVTRLVPLTPSDAVEMVDELRSQALLETCRGEPAVDRDALADVLLGLSRLAETDPSIESVDLNPILIDNGQPIAVDALVEQRLDSDTGGVEPSPEDSTDQSSTQLDMDAMLRLFEPRGVVVAGASTHPGKFGFVVLHNILASGYQGSVYATNRDQAQVLGVQTVASIDDLPEGEIDLVVVCTPAAVNNELLRQCATKGIGAAFITSAGYGEAGEEGLAAQNELVALGRELKMVIAGPNGQGLVSTPVDLCAQMVAPYPPRGHIGIASQSGNFVSSFQNWSLQSGVGVSRAISAGNAASLGVTDLLRYFAADPQTAVGLAYIEGLADGRELYNRARDITAQMPLVIVKGGATEGGARAAASHTGSLATDDRVFDGAMRQAGVVRAATVEAAFEAAASFATQPLPRGPRTVVVTTAGGWGVVTADAITASELELLELPGDLRARIDTLLPPRWSRNNPVDLAGGETRDTVPEVLSLIAEHDDVDAIIYLGLGIQSNQAALMASGPFYPGDGLERIVDFHRRQDERYAEAAAEISDSTGTPILAATELAIVDPDNPGPATVRRTGRLCYPSANRAVGALEAMWRYARFRNG